MAGQQSSSDPCYCRPWHRDCEPSTCPQAKFASGMLPASPLKDFRKSGERGCSTCAVIASALDIPSIRNEWKKSIEPALSSQRYGVVRALGNDEEEIRVELLLVDYWRDRRVLRTRASESSTDWRHFNFWCEEPSSLQDGKCRAFPALQYQPVERTDSARSMEHLKSWLKACTENHKCCPSEDPVLPARIVKVTEGCVRVFDAHGSRGRYTTLSHRWGETETFTLTKLSMSSMTDCIPWESIPKTYQESIEVTRLLGVDYIWIDTLCIVQDDADDWQRESAKMKSVYGNSYLNIAANHAADSYAGLFRASNLGTEYPAHSVPRDGTLRVRAHPYQTHWYFGSNYSHAGHSPLLQRGWVLQERILSPRVVYFDNDELKWECQVATDCQCGAMLAISNFKRDYHTTLHSPSGPGPASADEAPLPYEWMRISERYSSLRFTYDGDRVVALAGLAEQGAQSGKGGRYMGGLWERDFAHQVCWEVVNTHRRPEVPLVPSWSWLSVFGTVRNNNRMDFTTRGSRIDVAIAEVRCLGKDGGAPTTSTSPVTGFIRLKGRGVRMRAEVADAGGQGRPPAFRLRAAKGDGTGLEISFRADYAMAKEDAGAIKEVFLLYWGNICPDMNAFLALKPISVESLKFERLGIRWLPQGDKAKNLGKILAYCKIEDNIVIV